MYVLVAFYRIKVSLKLYLQYVFPKFIFPVLIQLLNYNNV